MSRQVLRENHHGATKTIEHCIWQKLGVPLWTIRAIHLRLEIAITYTFAFLDLAIHELHHMRCSALILRIHYIYSVSFCVNFSYGEWNSVFFSRTNLILFLPLHFHILPLHQINIHCAKFKLQHFKNVSIIMEFIYTSSSANFLVATQK